MNKEQKKRAAAIFAADPQLKELYVNKDGDFFTTKNYAQLAKKEFKTLKRSEVDAPKAKPEDTTASQEDLLAKEDLGEYLAELKRAELDSTAAVLNLDTKELPNKEEVAKAITAKVAELKAN